MQGVGFRCSQPAWHSNSWRRRWSPTCGWRWCQVPLLLRRVPRHTVLQF